MKLVVFFLCALRAVSANIRANEEHVYSYSGKILSGIPELEDTFSGLVIDSTVIIKAGSGRSPFTNTYKIAFKDVKFSSFNEKLSSPQPLNWRKMETPVTSPVTEV
jgi:hypothetical protein